MPSLHSILTLNTWLRCLLQSPHSCVQCGMSTSVQLTIAHRPESGSEPALAPQPRAGHRSRATAATVKVEIFSAAARWVLR